MTNVRKLVRDCLCHAHAENARQSFKDQSDSRVRGVIIAGTYSAAIQCSAIENDEQCKALAANTLEFHW